MAVFKMPFVVWHIDPHLSSLQQAAKRRAGIGSVHIVRNMFVELCRTEANTDRIHADPVYSTCFFEDACAHSSSNCSSLKKKKKGIVFI